MTILPRLIAEVLRSKCNAVLDMPLSDETYEGLAVCICTLLASADVIKAIARGIDPVAWQPLEECDDPPERRACRDDSLRYARAAVAAVTGASEEE